MYFNIIEIEKNEITFEYNTMFQFLETALNTIKEYIEEDKKTETRYERISYGIKIIGD